MDVSRSNQLDSGMAGRGLGRIALGGLGADSHTVGLFVLRHELQSAGFDVHDLGIQNEFDRLAAAAEFCDAVLVSNMDGHAAHYLADIDRLPPGCLWYLGGHPSIDGDIGPLDRLGFKRIYADFVAPEAVIAALRQDLPPPRRVPVRPAPPRPPQPVEIRLRTEVLGQWSTGREAGDIQDNAGILADRPSLAALQAAHAGPLLQPRSGVPGCEAQLDLFQALIDVGAHVVSFQVDSLTRDGRYPAVSRALSEGGRLNGFPVVNQGPLAIRRITAAVPTPVQTRHSARDPRLLAEVSYAGGVTAFEGGPICYNLPYYADLPIAASLANWQYVDSLTGQYAALGIVLDREFFGTLTATLVPPWLAIVTNLLEGRLAIAEGVRSVSLAYAEQGCRSQDIAAMRVMRRLGEELLGRSGAVRVATVFHQYMSAFPRHPEDAEGLIEASATTAAMGRADRILLKSPCEARCIPDASANARGLALAARGVAAVPALDAALIALEEDLIETAARAVFDAVLVLKPGDLPGAIVAAFETGVLDVPFSPSHFNAGRLLTARDARGAIRVLAAGGTPVPEEVRRFDADQLEPRLRSLGVSQQDGWRLISEDVLRTERGRLSWPLDAEIGEAQRQLVAAKAT